jgi:integrase
MTVSSAEWMDLRNGLIRLSNDPERVRASRSSANRIITSLRAALNLARQQRPHELPSDDPWRTGLQAIPNAAGSRNVFLSADEIRNLLASIDDRHFHDLVYALASCGARYGEIAACRVEDAHLDAKEGSRLHLPKGKTGPRTIAVTEELRVLLARLVSGRRGSEPLFTKSDGTAWGRDNQTKPMKQAVKAAGLNPEVTVYSLRHSWIAAALMAGVEVRIVADHCGTSVAMIEQTYSKFIGRHSGELIRKSGPKLTQPDQNVIVLSADREERSKTG